MNFNDCKDQYGKLMNRISVSSLALDSQPKVFEPETIDSKLTMPKYREPQLKKPHIKKSQRSLGFLHILAGFMIFLRFLREKLTFSP